MAACQDKEVNKLNNNDNRQEDTLSDTSKGISVAEKFINDYVANCNKTNEAAPTLEWIVANPYASPEFKQAAKKLIEDAYHDDPEMGLGFDPIFNAQDYPEEGFIINSREPSKIIAKAKGMENFTVPMSVTKVDGKWMVNSCGVINRHN
ncbi:hypothetical protein GWA97_06235 [Flavobacterium sp. LaA7.5]|nr:hypothetical protein [Flavobacterium salilacus subsp. altitudinum]